MATVSQTHRAFYGIGQLVRSNEPPIAVRYDIVVAARPVGIFTDVAPDEQQWEWDKAEGFVTLVNSADVGLVQPGQAYTLMLPDGRQCRPTLRHGYNMAPMRFLIECLPSGLVDGGSPGEDG